MQGGHNMAEEFLYFIIYSFLGFLLEVVFARVTRSRKQDRKCMVLLPLCPVYGIGALLIVHLPGIVRNNPILLFFCGALAATAAEYGMDWFYETAWKVRFWDYSSMPWNLNGRVCLLFSLAWGLLALPLTAWVHPLVTRWVPALPSGLALSIGLCFLLDTLFTTWLLRTTKDTASLRWYDRLHGILKKS